jgi:hypothetical protein
LKDTIESRSIGERNRGDMDQRRKGTEKERNK